MPELDWRDDDGDAAAAGAISPVTLSAPAENKQPHKRHGHGTAMDARGSSILAWLVNLQTHTRTSRCRRDTHRRFPPGRLAGGGPAPPLPYARLDRDEGKGKAAGLRASRFRLSAFRSCRSHAKIRVPYGELATHGDPATGRIEPRLPPGVKRRRLS